MFVDLPLDQLRDYRPEVAEPADFDAFWNQQVTAADAHDLDATFVRVDAFVTHADVFDVTFSGHGGDRIKAWLLVPHEVLADAPVVLEYIGYGGGRGRPFDWLTYSCAGYPHLVMDTRGQGGEWLRGDTADQGSGAPSTPGFMTRGIEDPKDHYYTRLFVDAARAVAAVRAHPVSEGRRIVTTGRSQGGGLSLAAANLSGGVAATMPDVPFLAHFRRAVEITDSRPYGELINYCGVHMDRVDQVFATLSYIDVVNHARRIEVPALFSVGLVDDITPASTVFAAYNHYAGPKQIKVYTFNAHEGGGTDQKVAQLAFLREGSWRD